MQSISELPQLENDNVLLYSRFQGEVKFDFYVTKDGKLLAETTKDGETEKAEVVKGLPWQDNLNDPWRQTKVKQALSQCFFHKTGYYVEVNPRGLGGWGDKTHEDHTRTWAIEMSFTLEAANLIAAACKQIDYFPETAPLRWPLEEGWRTLSEQKNTNQRWHFNSNDPESQYGGINDTRIQLAAECFRCAVNAYKRGEMNKASVSLGCGLHPLQDIFAHSNKLVSDNFFGSISIYSHNSKELKESAAITVGLGVLTAELGYISYKEAEEGRRKPGLEFLTCIAAAGTVAGGVKTATDFKAFKNNADDPCYIDEKAESPSSLTSDVDGKNEYVKYGWSQRHSDTRTATYLYLNAFLRVVGAERYQEQIQTNTVRIERRLANNFSETVFSDFDKLYHQNYANQGETATETETSETYSPS